MSDSRLLAGRFQGFQRLLRPESTLGLYLIDFGFEREVAGDSEERKLKSGIKVGDDTQPPAKRTKPDANSEVNLTDNKIDSRVT